MINKHFMFLKQGQVCYLYYTYMGDFFFVDYYYVSWIFLRYKYNIDLCLVSCQTQYIYMRDADEKFMWQRKI